MEDPVESQIKNVMSLAASMFIKHALLLYSITDAEGRSQNLYTTLFNGVIIHRALIGIVQILPYNTHQNEDIQNASISLPLLRCYGLSSWVMTFRLAASVGLPVVATITFQW